MVDLWARNVRQDEGGVKTVVKGPYGTVGISNIAGQTSLLARRIVVFSLSVLHDRYQGLEVRRGAPDFTLHNRCCTI